MIDRTRLSRAQTLCGVAAACLVSGTAAHAQASVHFHISPQPLAPALLAFSSQSGLTVVADVALTRGKTSVGYTAVSDPETALRTLLSGTGLTIRRRGKIFLIGNDKVSAVEPAQTTTATPGTQSDAASSADIVVTAQKRSERIQDVPIAISAFTQQTLDKQKIEGGPDLLKAVPNLTFSKSNFAGYNLSIRGIGTKAISVTTDPGVAVNFNSSTLITNRFFEQEFFDLERVEVLRGPQGTLYGRNATGGVVNIISNKADLTKFDGYLKAEVGNFGSRRAQGAINVPIIPDVLGLRLAGAYTNRDGFTTNDITNRLCSPAT